MTCQGCVASVTEKLSKVKGVSNVKVDLASKEATIAMEVAIPVESFAEVLSNKYTIEAKTDATQSVNIGTKKNNHSEKSKWVQLRPLFLIFAYLFAASILLNFANWNTGQAMLDFMGLFYIVFSFFKLLDLKGFPDSFRMYDPLAKAVPIYGWVYPFIELGLGLLFLMRIQIEFALIATIIILGITTYGVAQTLLNKKKIRCACLGTALQLPMTEATIIENSMMLLMAVFMVVQL